MTNGFTDIHQHLMYGMDDGPETLEEALDMLRAAQEDGIRRIVVTPHVAPGIERFDHELYFSRFEALADNARGEGITLLPGSEILFTEATRRHLDEGRVPALAGTRYVLVEFSPDVPYGEMRDGVESLLVGGYFPVLAHVERYECLVKKSQRAIDLKKQLDVRYQVNCSTVIRGKGFTVNRFCKKLFEDGLVDAVATDAHNVGSRPVLMSAAYRVLEKHYGEVYAEQLTVLNKELLF